MKIFNAVLLAGLFAAVAALDCDLDIKILKVVDSDIEDKDFAKFTTTLQVKADKSVKDLIETDIDVELFLNPETVLANEVISVTFMEEDCTLRGSGKSAVCKDEWSRITISEIKAPKDLFDEDAGSTYTYFKLSVVLRKVELLKELTDDLVVKIKVDGCPSVVQRMDCDLKKFNSREQAICKKNVDPSFENKV